MSGFPTPRSTIKQAPVEVKDSFDESFDWLDFDEIYKGGQEGLD